MLPSEVEGQRCLREILRCRKSFVYFCDTYCQILSDAGQGGSWTPFRLWPEQRRVAGLLEGNRLVEVLKARQLGLTWLVLAFALWLMLFHPIATVLLFSRRDDEATDLLAVRLHGMHDHLPAWLQAGGAPPTTSTSGRCSAGRGPWPSRPRRATVTRRRWRSWMRPTCAPTSTG